MSLALLKNTCGSYSPLKTLIDIFTGKYQSKNTDIKELKEDILNIDGPGSFVDDKLNLSKDVRNIAHDLKVSFDEYKELYNNG